MPTFGEEEGTIFAGIERGAEVKIIGEVSSDSFNLNISCGSTSISLDVSKILHKLSIVSYRLFIYNYRLIGFTKARANLIRTIHTYML